jgi:chromosome partitioning protein
VIITIASHKGGVGKTTTAIHVAACLQMLAPTLLLDGDRKKNALKWAMRGEAFPFRVAPIEAAAMLSRDFEHIVIDTGQQLSDVDLQAAAESCHLLIVPTCPGSRSDTDGLAETIRSLQGINANNFKVLLTKVAADDALAAARLRDEMAEANIACFHAEIPLLKAYRKASGEGVIVSAQVDRKNGDRAWQAYFAAGQEIAR